MPPSRRADEPEYQELPTDIASLAHILEAAMTSGVSDDVSSPKAQLSTPNSQLPTPKAERDFESTDSQTPDVEISALDVLQESARDDAPPRRRRMDEPLTAPGPPVRSEEPSRREAVAFDEVARSLGAAEACVPLLAQSTGLLRIAALDVVKAESARAGGLLQLLRFLRGDLTLAMTAVSTSAVLQRVMQSAESERRLRGIALTSRSSVADATCAGDETLLGNTLLALLLTTFAAIEGVQNARTTLSLTVSESGEIGFGVSQDHVAAPAAWLAQTASDELTTETGQALPAIALSGARRLAQQWGGRFAMAGGEHSTILTIWLPTVQPGDVEQTAH